MQDVQHLERPLVVIVGISDYKFGKKLPCVDKDIQKVEKLAQNLDNADIVVIKKINQRYELLTRLQSIRNYKRFWTESPNDGIIFFYTGHGSENAMVAANGNSYPWSDVFEFVRDYMFPGNQPKIFIIDSCRGHKAAQSIPVSFV